MKASKRFKQSMHDLIINQYGINGPYPSYYRIYFDEWQWANYFKRQNWIKKGFIND